MMRVQFFIFLRRFSIFGLSLCLRIGILIFSFIGSELAETDVGVADLPAWDNIGCRECNLFEAFFDFWIGFMFAHWNSDFQLHRTGIG